VCDGTKVLNCELRALDGVILTPDVNPEIDPVLERGAYEDELRLVELPDLNLDAIVVWRHARVKAPVCVARVGSVAFVEVLPDFIFAKVLTHVRDGRDPVGVLTARVRVFEDLLDLVEPEVRPARDFGVRGCWYCTPIISRVRLLVFVFVPDLAKDLRVELLNLRL